VASRLLPLLALAGLACFASVAPAHPAEPVRPAPRTAVPERTEPVAERCPVPHAFRRAFVRAAHDTGLQLSMLVAVAQVESEFKPDARSVAGAKGLMQVVPSTAQELKLDVDRPAANVLAGARYLKQMLGRFARVDLALAAYNAGPTIVERLGRAPNLESVSYVANVQQHWSALAGCT
jgi:soluble lytic murein transglycosylase-like protein